MSQKLTPAVGRGLLAAAETLNYNMGESNPDPYSSTSQHVGGRVGYGGGDRQDLGSQLPSQLGSQLSNTMKLFSSLGVSPADLDALAKIPEDQISVETLPHLIMQLKNSKNLTGDPPVLSSDTSYRDGRDDWGDMQGGRLDRSVGQGQNRTQSSFGYSSMQDVSTRGYDVLEYGNRSRGRQYSDLSSDSYHGLGMGSSSAADDLFMQRRMGAPSQGKIEDFLGVRPQMFPHVCALCDFDVHSDMEWNQHTDGLRHAENRRVLLQLYPDWDPQMLSGRMSESFSYDSRGRSDRLSGAVRQRTGMSSNWGSESGMASQTQPYSKTPKVRSRVVVVKYERRPVLSNLFALARSFGTIKQHLVLNNKAFLELHSHEQALAMSDHYHKNPAILHGKQVHVYISKELLVIEKDDRVDRDTKNVKEGTSPVVFFSNLPRETEKKAELLTIARRFGTVDKHLFLNDEAFVQMSTAGEADMLVKYFRLNPLTIDRRAIRLNICTKYKNLRVPPEKEGKERKDRDEGSQKGSSRTSHKARSRSPVATSSKSKERSFEKEGEAKSEKENKDVTAEGSGIEEEGSVEGHDENEGPAVEKSQEEATEEQTNPEDPLNYEDSKMEQANDDKHDAEGTEMLEEADHKSENASEPEADQNNKEERKDTDDQDDMENPKADQENAPENLGELEGLEEFDFPDSMDDFVTLDELADEEDAERHDWKSRDRSTTGRSKQSGGLKVVNVVGFRRGFNYLDEILSLAKPFGTVVRHLVLDVRPEAFLELSSEQEARAMVRFYNGNVTPTVCRKEVKVFHSHVYSTIQYGKVVYVGHIPPFKSDASLLKIAEPFGKVKCYFVNRVRNECFIEMERTEDAERFVEASKENPPKFQGKRLVVYMSRKYKHLKQGLRPPTPEPEDKRPSKRGHSDEESESPVSSSAKTKTKEEEPPIKKVKETSCTDIPAEKQVETSESEGEMTIENTEENGSDAVEAQNMESIKTVDYESSDDGVPEKSQENIEASSVPSQSVKKPVTTLDTLGPYEPNVPVGVEFVKMGYYCRVCFLFYSNEDTAKKVHCSSQAHYDKLKKHLEKEKASAKSEDGINEAI